MCHWAGQNVGGERQKVLSSLEGRDQKSSAVKRLGSKKFGQFDSET